MKLFVKLMLALLVLAVLLPFTLLKNEQGNTLVSFSDFKLPDFNLPELPKLSSGKNLIPAKVGSGGVDTFYKWYDTKGNVQFTTEPPPDGVEYTVKQFDPNTNVIQAVELPADDADVATSAGANAVSEKSPPEKAEQDLPSPYSKESIEKLFEDARNIKDLMNQRTNSQNDTIN
jgi:hypothetical protein